MASMPRVLTGEDLDTPRSQTNAGAHLSFAAIRSHFVDFVVSRAWFHDTLDLQCFLIYLYLSAVLISVLLLEYFVLRSGARTFGISAGISIGLVLETLACLR